jgi:hypothetical protein
MRRPRWAARRLQVVRVGRQCTAAAQTQWQAGWPPGRRPKGSVPRRARGIRVAVGCPRAAVGWIMTRTAGPAESSAHRGGRVRCRQPPAAVSRRPTRGSRAIWVVLDIIKTASPKRPTSRSPRYLRDRSAGCATRTSRVTKTAQCVACASISSLGHLQIAL